MKKFKENLDFKNIGIFRKQCICGKAILSFNKEQFENNWAAHVLMHKNKNKKRKAQ